MTSFLEIHPTEERAQHEMTHLPYRSWCTLRSVESCTPLRVILGRTHIVEILVPTVSLMVDTAWVRNWDVNHENLNQILKGWKSSL